MTPAEAWALLTDVLEQDTGHGGGHHDHDCPICCAIRIVAEALQGRTAA